MYNRFELEYPQRWYISFLHYLVHIEVILQVKNTTQTIHIICIRIVFGISSTLKGAPPVMIPHLRLCGSALKPPLMSMVNAKDTTCHKLTT